MWLEKSIGNADLHMNTLIMLSIHPIVQIVLVQNVVKILRFPSILFSLYIFELLFKRFPFRHIHINKVKECDSLVCCCLHCTLSTNNQTEYLRVSLVFFFFSVFSSPVVVIVFVVSDAFVLSIICFFFFSLIFHSNTFAFGAMLSNITTATIITGR